ncbi:protein FAR1-RELATED SEQUENCE 5-like [Primulina eburnea]|uniref:protein FAR1-RELATED SEQUENCE 5-like n=1 Tax=Primulina eburnea TaxID=1245227 RepID=UPI003C6C36E6
MDENSGDEMSYIPQVGDNQKPKIGMKFESLDEAFSFYNQYARESGFSARMSNSKKSKKTKEVIWKKFVCFKEGHTDAIRWSKQSKSDVPIKEIASGEIRTGSKKALSQQFAEENVPTCQQMRLFEIESGGPEHVGCTERDIRNYEKTLRDEHKGIDAETLIDFFMSEKDKSSTFFFDYETDSDNRFIRCFWADPVSRRAYTAFGDVVVFDTIYNTNKYGMIFASFVGVNHHHQTIVFGCGFLSDEKTDSFVWLLNKFLEAMPKGAPNLIITDQDPAITKAIAEVFPKTIHRYCLWHILNKFPDKLNPVTFRDHYQSIKNVIVHSTTSIEFERSWEDVMNCANFVENDWLSLMYELRHKWVPAYFNHVFSAGMSSSQRSESSHAFFKRYVCNKNSLMDFIIRFNKALRHQRHNELVADHTDMNERPKVKSNWPMELQMVNVYTKNKWLEFQNEISLSHGYYVQQASIGIEFGVYNVINFQGSSSAKHRLLTHDIQRDDISCSCMKFQFEGIPCRHMLAFFRINQVFHLPDQYILKRWTKDAKVGVLYTMAEQNLVDDPERCLMSRHMRLSCKASALIDVASFSDEGTNFLADEFDSIDSKMKEMNINRTLSSGIQSRSTFDKAIGIIDPSEIRTKGRGKRLKSSKEKSISRGRQCRGWGHRGVSHDKRNCPNLKDGSTLNNNNTDENSDEEDFGSIDGMGLIEVAIGRIQGTFP